MEKVKLNDINLDSLKKLQSQGTMSTIYTDGNLCYKMLDGLYPDEKRAVYYKFLDMDGIKIDNVLLPKDLIIADGNLQGYTMSYFGDSMPLSDKFLKRYFNCKDVFKFVDKASKVLRIIHNNDIVLQDLSFENILVNDLGDIQFCDIDGCSYKKSETPFVSILFKRFIDYRKTKLSTEEDIDKISMILSLYLIMYGEELQKITKRQYHLLSDHVDTLENLRSCANMLVNKNIPIESLPYLDEVIDLSDDYEIDRNKILNLKQRIFKNKRT